jgi:hypothetical protein
MKGRTGFFVDGRTKGALLLRGPGGPSEAVLDQNVQNVVYREELVHDVFEMMYNCLYATIRLSPLTRRNGDD